MNRIKPHVALLVCNVLWAMDYPFYTIVLPRYAEPMVAASLVATASLLLVPLLVLLLSVLLGMDRFPELKVTGLVLGMAGAVAVVLTGASSAHAHSHLWGNVLVLLCACATLFYMVWFKTLAAKYRVTTVLRWVYCGAAVMALPFGLSGIVTADYATIARHALFPTLFVLLVPTYIPNLILNYTLKYVKPTVSSVYTYLQPVLAIVLRSYSVADQAPLSRALIKERPERVTALASLCFRMIT